MKPIKSITNEAWLSKHDRNFFGKKMLIFIDRATGKELTFVLEEERTEPRYIIQNDGSCELDPAECWGNNGFKRATWQSLLIDQQVKEEEDEDNIL